MAVISFKSHSLDRLMIMTNNEKVRWLNGSTQRFSHTTTRSCQFDTQEQWGGTGLAKKSLRGFLARWPFGVSPVTIKNLTYTVLRTSGGLAAVLNISHTPIRGRQFDTQEQRGGTGLAKKSLRGFLARWPFGLENARWPSGSTERFSHTTTRGRQFDTQGQRGGTGLAKNLYGDFWRGGPSG
ncbi:hypothetical protein Bca4012_073530 [Brassica carinata]